MCLIESSYVDVTAWLQDGQLLETLAPRRTIPTFHIHDCASPWVSLQEWTKKNWAKLTLISLSK